MLMLDNNPRGTICIEDIEMGMTRYVRKVITDQDIEKFAEISTDHNPVHLDDEYARDTIFEGRIAHGMLTAGLVSAVIGEQLPGHGTIYMSQNLKFLGPVFINDEVMVRITVESVDSEKKRVRLVTECFKSEKKVIFQNQMLKRCLRMKK